MWSCSKQSALVFTSSVVFDELAKYMHRRETRLVIFRLYPRLACPPIFARARVCRTHNHLSPNLETSCSLKSLRRHKWFNEEMSIDYHSGKLGIIRVFEIELNWLMNFRLYQHQMLYHQAIEEYSDVLFCVPSKVAAWPNSHTLKLSLFVLRTRGMQRSDEFPGVV